jgi:hypothetical protein
MKSFKIISQIELKKGQLVCSLKDGKGKQNVHQRQGSLDGACSAYSLSMALIILGVVNAEDIINNSLRKNTREGKFIRDLVENNGLYTDGKTFSQIKDLIDLTLNKIVDTSLLKKSKKTDIIKFVIQNVENEVPVLLHIRSKGENGHAILVVGLSYDNNEKLDSFLCLDPGFEAPSISCWNCMIKINSTINEFPHNWYTIDGIPQSNVYIQEALAIYKRQLL